MTHELQHGAAWWEVRIQRPSSLSCRAVKQHVGPITECAHIAVHAEGGACGVPAIAGLPSHNGRLVAPSPNLTMWHSYNNLKRTQPKEDIAAS